MKRITGIPDIRPNEITYSGMDLPTAVTRGWTVELSAADEKVIFIGANAHERAIEYAKARYGAVNEEQVAAP